MPHSHKISKGRGSGSNPDNRFDTFHKQAFDDGWDNQEIMPAPIQTTLIVDSAKSIITYNQSPDVPFDRSINPYRGCEHGCSYCFARPTHAYLGYSAGLDFETKLSYKPNAAELLRRELGKKSYHCQPIALGINTDAYQPMERKLGITREILKVLAETKHPVSIVTKSAMIERDLDILAPMAEKNLVHVAISVTTLDRELARKLEPRAAAPQRRLQTIKRLSEAGVPTSLFMAPLIPMLTDHELETLFEKGKEAGAHDAMYILLRLPLETKQLFQEWLQTHEPLKAERIMNRIRDCRGGKEYDSQFGQRMTGNGIYADLIRQRFHKITKKLNFKGISELDISHFKAPVKNLPQMELF